MLPLGPMQRMILPPGGEGVVRRAGYNIVTWTNDDIVYRAASDLNLSELQLLARLLSTGMRSVRDPAEGNSARLPRVRLSPFAPPLHVAIVQYGRCYGWPASHM